MTEEEILDLFRTKAAAMDGEPTKSDLVRDLALLLATSGSSLSKENFETLLDVGAAIYRLGLTQFNATTDVAEIMRESLEGGKRD